MMSDQTRQNIAAALQAHALDEWDGDLVTHWVAIAGIVGGVESDVGIVASFNPMPRYIAVGLVAEGVRWADEDDN